MDWTPHQIVCRG